MYRVEHNPLYFNFNWSTIFLKFCCFHFNPHFNLIIVTKYFIHTLVGLAMASPYGFDFCSLVKSEIRPTIYFTLLVARITSSNFDGFYVMAFSSPFCSFFPTMVSSVPSNHRSENPARNASSRNIPGLGYCEITLDVDMSEVSLINAGIFMSITVVVSLIFAMM